MLGDYTPSKRVALVAAMVLSAQTRARDDTAEMFCRRVGALVKRAREELEALRAQHREITERLVSTYRTVLEGLDPAGPAAGQAVEHAAREQAAGGAAGRRRGRDQRAVVRPL